MKLSCLTLSGCVAVVSVAASASASIDINGGTSWGGWNSLGQSVSTGIWAGGTTARNFEIYTTVFTFNNNTVSGSPTQPGFGPRDFAAGSNSPGAFQNGNLIFGLGLRMTGGQSILGHNFVGFSLGSNNLQAASSIGATDGRANMRENGRQGDFVTWIDGVGGGPSEVAALKQDGFGPGTPSSIISNLSGGNLAYDFAFRSFQVGPTNGSVQMFFDFTAMQALYGAGGPFSGAWSNGPAAIGTIGSSITISLYNDNQTWTAGSASVFGVAVPAPGALALFGAAGLRRSRRRSA